MYSSTYADNLPGVVAAARLPSNPPFQLGLTPNDRLADLMGYCGSSWFSTYNYHYVQKFLENRTAAAQAALTQARAQALMFATAGASARGYLVLSGLIDAQGITLSPAQVLPSPPIAPHAGGPYAMTIRTRAGEVINVNFTASDVGDGDAKSFTVVVPDPGPVASVEVSKSLRVIPMARSSTRARAQSSVAPTGTAERASVAWALEDEKILVQWNVAVEPFLGVTLVHRDGRREVIASELTGGSARVTTGLRPPGAIVELTLGSEFGARTVVAK